MNPWKSEKASPQMSTWAGPRPVREKASSLSLTLQAIQALLVVGQIVFRPPLPRGRGVVLGKGLGLRVQVVEKLSGHRLVNRIELDDAE
jgi:hypothetical protein